MQGGFSRNEHHFAGCRTGSSSTRFRNPPQESAPPREVRRTQARRERLSRPVFCPRGRPTEPRHCRRRRRASALEVPGRVFDSSRLRCAGARTERSIRAEAGDATFRESRSPRMESPRKNRSQLRKKRSQTTAANSASRPGRGRTSGLAASPREWSFAGICPRGKKSGSSVKNVLRQVDRVNA